MIGGRRPRWRQARGGEDRRRASLEAELAMRRDQCERLSREVERMAVTTAELDDRVRRLEIACQAAAFAMLRPAEVEAER